MRKAETQHNHAQNQPAQRQGNGAALESPQGEQIAQLEALADASPQAGRLAQLTAMANNSPRMSAQRKAISAIHNSPNVTAQRQQIDSLTGETAQREAAPAKPNASTQLSTGSKPNHTGLPDNLKSGIENLSGMSMDNVKVHYNSSQPAQLNALAYAQGRVKPTMQMKGTAINDDARLEGEADLMGGMAVQMVRGQKARPDPVAPAIHNSPNVMAQRQRIGSLTGEIAQREEAEEPLQPKVTQREAAPAKPNNTGLPDNLKSGIESLSGMSMDNVKVHYNSSQPAQLNAHAYAQGTDIHVAPGQERYLPHEAWHVVQQAQGRVKPTMQMKGGVPVNDDAGLEREADMMGAKAATGEGTGRLISRRVASLQKVRIHDTNDAAAQRQTEITHSAGHVKTNSRETGREEAHVVGKAMSAKLDVGDPVVGTATGVNWTWMQKLRATYPKAGVVRGHLLNHDLGGFSIPENLYPISTQANADHSEKVEQKVKALLSAAEQADKQNPGTARRIQYTVNVTETNAENPRQATFNCVFGIEGGLMQKVPIDSDLGTDKGGFRGSGREAAPRSWQHGDRRGADVEQLPLKDYRDNKKINVIDASSRTDSVPSIANVNAPSSHRPSMLDPAVKARYDNWEPELGSKARFALKVFKGLPREFKGLKDEVYADGLERWREDDDYHPAFDDLKNSLLVKFNALVDLITKGDKHFNSAFKREREKLMPRVVPKPLKTRVHKRKNRKR